MIEPFLGTMEFGHTNRLPNSSGKQILIHSVTVFNEMISSMRSKLLAYLRENASQILNFLILNLF